MRNRFAITLSFLLTILVSAAVMGQESNYLTQKLMVENDLRQRIRDALSKIMDESRFVVDVTATLELSDETEEKVTFVPGSESKSKAAATGQVKSLEQKATPKSKQKESQTMVGLPIPGFEFEVEKQQSDVDEILPDELPVPAAAKPETTDEKVLSKTASVKRLSVAKIQKMEISVILQEGVAPELIENVRQIVMVAARYNRARGDVLSIMSASFKDRRDEKTAEQILLKNIAEKLEVLEQTRRAADDSREEDWQNELAAYKNQEAKRREEDRNFFKNELTALEAAAKERSFQQEKKEILRKDSIKLQALNQEIQQLKEFLDTGPLSDSAATKTRSAVSAKEGEKASIDSMIEKKIAELESVQGDLDRLQKDSETPTYVIVILSLLGALLLVLLVALLFLAFNRARQPAYPPPWMYPPRRFKKKSRPDKPVKEAEPVAAATPPPPPAAPVAAPQQQAQVEEDPSVLQSEIGDIRKSIVSMSVGQPETTTRIVKEWMEEEAPPPPAEPEPAPAPEEDQGGKKRKKK